MMEHLRTRGFLILLIFLFVYFLAQSTSSQVLGTSAVRESDDLLANEVTVSTKTAFDQKEVIEEEVIPFEIEYKKDPDMEYGEEEILEEGVDGVKRTKYLITHWFNITIDKVVSGIETVEPKTQIVAKGTKVVWREADIEGNEIKYWRKIKVWATKYDGNCFGCRGLTFSGTKVVKGVCAVDPKVIPLGTNFYVERYGFCRSEDIGGAIKGNKVDLGFEDASKAAWGAEWTNVYLMTSWPTE